MNILLLLYAIVIIEFISAILHIILGICKAEKSKRYGIADVLAGICGIVLLLVVLNT